MSKYGVISSLYFNIFLLNAVNLRIQSEYRKILTRKNSVFGHFSGSEGIVENFNPIQDGEWGIGGVNRPTLPVFPL